jgi:hypothetical protein
MSFWTNISGIFGSLFQIGGPSGPKWKAIFTGGIGSAIEARNSVDATYLSVRGADPSIDDDLATKRYVDVASGGVVDLTGAAKHTTGNATAGGGTTSSHIHVTITKGIVLGLRVRALGNTVNSNIEFFSHPAGGVQSRIYWAPVKDCYTLPYHKDYTPWCIPQFDQALQDDELEYTITNNGANDSTYEIEMRLIGEI